MRRSFLVISCVLACEGGGDSDSTDTSDGTGGPTSSATTVTDASTVGESSTTMTSTTASTSSNPTTTTTVGDESSTSAGDDESSSTGEPADTIAVAVGYGTRRVRSDDGLTWTDFVEVNPDGGDDDELLRGIGWGDGIFLAVGGAGAGFSMRSFDGITWQDETHTLNSFVSDVAWQGGTFVAGGGNGLRVRSLDGGVTWQDQTEYFAGHYRAIAAGNGIFVAVGHTYGDTNDGLIAITVDGASWDAEQLVGAPYQGLGIAFGAGMFVIRDEDGAVRSSSDGTQWNVATIDAGGGGAVLFADGQFVIAGESSFWTSSDGEEWSELAGDVRTPAGWIEGQYLTLGWPATIDASSDLQSWQNVFAPGGSGLTDIAVGWTGS
ncbi:MAG TPA: hypothetical protein VG755_44555 [Nannocystaceae bacterium]|nr:hypothetical protein [Nannocystaceae bacterium]